MFPELAARENGLKGELRRLEQDQSVTRTALAVRDAELEQARGEILTRDQAIAELETTLTAGESNCGAERARAQPGSENCVHESIADGARQPLVRDAKCADARDGSFTRRDRVLAGGKSSRRQ